MNHSAPARPTEDDFLPINIAMAKYQAERIEPLLDTYRLDDHEQFKDFERRKGVVLHSSRFLHRLKEMEPKLIIWKQEMFDDWGLYLHVNGATVFISQVSKGWLTEFSYTEVDHRNLPSEPHWGWRTVLLRLMEKGVFTWEQVVKEFGHSTGANSDRWFLFTEPFRNHHSTGIVHSNLRAHIEN
jgi:hypothetical protein